MIYSVSRKSFCTYSEFVKRIYQDELLCVFANKIRHAHTHRPYKLLRVGGISDICCNKSKYEKCILLWTLNVLIVNSRYTVTFDSYFVRSMVWPGEEIPHTTLVVFLG